MQLLRQNIGHTVLLLVSVFVIGFSCKNPKQSEDPIQSGEKKEGLVQKNSLDSLPTGKVRLISGKKITAGKPLVVLAGKPEIHSGFNNEHPLGITKTLQALSGNLLSGVHPFIKKAVPKKIPYTHSKILPAQTARMREQNPLGLKFYDVEQGLSSSYIRCSLQDRQGNIWFGTGGGGASKFDGSDFTHFTERQGLPNNFVVSILEDHAGNIWFGTDGGGVCKYDGTDFTLFTEKEGLINNAVWSMVEDHAGNIWFGTAGGGVCKYDGKQFTSFNKDSGLNSNYIVCMTVDMTGAIWMGTFGDGVLKYSGDQFRSYTEADGLAANTVQAIYADKKGSLWFGTDGSGISQLTGGRFINYTEGSGLLSNEVNIITQDREGNMWFGFNRLGACKFNGIYFTTYTEQDGLSGGAIQSILEDSNDNIWFGTAGHGITKYDKSCFTHFTKKEGLSSNAVYASFEDQQHQLWFGTANGVCKYDGNTFYQYTTEQGLMSDKILCISEDSAHHLWFGTPSGACKFDGKYFYHYTAEQGLSGNKIYTIYEDRKHRMWFATQGGGACVFDGKSFTQYSTEQGISSENVYDILEDQAGHIWLTTDGGGVCELDGQNLTVFSKKEGLSSNVVYAVLQDKKGSLWFGTDEAGVCRYDGKKFQTFTEANGLSNNKVWSILQDKAGPIWLGTENGLTRIEQNALQKDRISCSTYKLSEGFLGNDVLQNSVFQDSKGFIWWGTGKMLTRYDARLDKADKQAPVMHLKHIKLQFQTVDWKNIGANETLKNVQLKQVSHWYEIPEGLSLPYDQNRISFHYVGINYKSQDKILYQYNLEGLDDKWISAGTKTEIAYSNLPPNRYSFKVRAVNKDEVWSEPLSFTFVIRPPWWQTWWFRISAIIAGIGVIVIAFRVRTGALRKKQKELEALISARTAEVVSQKELLQEKNKEVLDSINYAQRIQRSILPSAEDMQKALHNHFVLYKPKAIISGDFYWMAQVQTHTTEAQLVVLAVVDCTGHGVPGALMSIVGNTLLNQTIKNSEINTPAQALDFLNHELPKNLKSQQKGEIIRDGMDMVMCALDFKNKKLYFAGANNSLYLIRKGELIEIAGDKQAISGSIDDVKKPFSNHTFELETGDILYLLTDGFADQFGGPKGKKFKHKQVVQTLLQVHSLSMNEQKEKIYKAFEDWRGDQEQVDDVTVIAVQI